MKTIRVLLVEDSTLICERLGRMFADIEGIEIVGGVATESEAVEAVHHLWPDVLILDLELKEGSGLEVLKEVRQSGQACTVVVLTNHAYPQFREACRLAGADYFFDKSTSFGRVLEVLEGMTQEWPGANVRDSRLSPTVELLSHDRTAFGAQTCGQPRLN